MIKRFTVLLAVALLAAVPQPPLQSLTKKQKSWCIGGAIFALSSLYYFSQYKKKHANKNTYSSRKNVMRSIKLGLVTGATAGALAYLLTDSQEDSSGSMTPGFINPGNNCFMNAVLQCELNSPQVKRALSTSTAAAPNTGLQLFTSLAHDALGKSGPYNPSAVHTYIRTHLFPGSGQEDAHEFLLSYIDKVGLENVYQWREATTSTCTHASCRKSTQVIDPQTSIEISLDGNLVQLSTLIDNYAQGITEADTRCDHCSRLGIKTFTRKPTQKSLRLPIHLIRFDHFGNKKNSGVPFQEKLMFFETPYILQSFVVHRGKTLRYGHYVAYVKDMKNNRWYCYNDSLRTFVSQDDINTILTTGLETDGGTPYIINYEQSL